MARPHDRFICTICETEALQWAGRCPSCGQWNSLITMIVSDPNRRNSVGTNEELIALNEVNANGGDARPLASGISELDRVLGGGFVAGSSTLLFGPPGVGKSTLLFQVLASVASSGLEVVLAVR